MMGTRIDKPDAMPEAPPWSLAKKLLVTALVLVGVFAAAIAIAWLRYHPH
jgi:hypothetical protein